MVAHVNELGRHLEPTLRRFGVVKAAVYGSEAGGEATPESEFDLLVEFGPGRSLFDLSGPRQEFAEILRSKPASSPTNPSSKAQGTQSPSADSDLMTRDHRIALSDIVEPIDRILATPVAHPAVVLHSARARPRFAAKANP